MKVGDRVKVLPYKTLYEKQGKLRYKIWTTEEDYRGKTGVVFEYESLPDPDPDIPEIDLGLPPLIPVKFDDGFVGHYNVQNLESEE